MSKKNKPVKISLITTGLGSLHLPKHTVASGVVTHLSVIIDPTITESLCPLVVILADDASPEELVQCALIVRNYGRTAIVCKPGEIPADLIMELTDFIVQQTNAGDAIRHEVLIIGDMIEALASVDGIDKLN